MPEIWRPLTNINKNFLVSSTGKIKTTDRHIAPDRAHPKGQFIKGRVRSTKNTTHRYESIIIDGIRYYVHRLVAAYFIGDNYIPDGFEVNHKNGNTKDNRVENLEIVAHQDNMTHATKVLNRWQQQAERQNRPVFCVELQKEFESMKKASEYFGDYRNKGGGIGVAIRQNCRAFGYHWKFS